MVLNYTLKNSFTQCTQNQLSPLEKFECVQPRLKASQVNQVWSMRRLIIGMLTGTLEGVGSSITG